MGEMMEIIKAIIPVLAIAWVLIVLIVKREDYEKQATNERIAIIGLLGVIIERVL